MAKSLDKKKANSTLHEYGDKHVNFYNNSAVRNELINQTLSNQINHTYYQPQERAVFK